MQNTKRVQKLVSQISLLVLGTALLLSNVGLAASNKTSATNSKSSFYQKAAKKPSAKKSASTTKRKSSAKNVAPRYRPETREEPVTLTSSQSQNVNLNAKGIKVISTKKNYFNNEEIRKTPALLASNTSFKRKTVLQQNSMNADLALDEDDKIISGAVSLSYARSLVDFQDGSRSESQTANIQLSGKISDNWTASVGTAVSQDNRDAESLSNGFGDTSISLSQKRSKITDSLKGGFSFTTLLPTSKYSNEYQGLQSLLGVSYGVSFLDDVLIDGLSLSFGVGVSRLFHKYDTDVAGTVLTQTSLRESVSTSYSYKNISFSFELNHRSGWTYQNNVKNAYEASEEISYAILPTWGVSLGHTNSEAWLKPNGQDSNLKLINENNSIVYISSSVMF